MEPMAAAALDTLLRQSRTYNRRRLPYVRPYRGLVAAMTASSRAFPSSGSSSKTRPSSFPASPPPASTPAKKAAPWS